MILQKEINENSVKFKVPPATIDKDWVLGHLLNGIVSFEELKNLLIFKGGTCLKKCFFENYRFSEDLDFTLLDEKFEITEKLIRAILKITEKNSGAFFDFKLIKNQIHNDVDQGYEVKIKFWGANHKANQKPLPPSRWQTEIKLDISFSEKLLSEPEIHQIIHAYSDEDLITEKVKTYSMQEIVAEKVRSLVQRNRPRDVFDNWYFSKQIKTSLYPIIKNLLIQKAQNKNVDISKLENFVNEKKKNANKRAWESSLAHQISKEHLPDFDEAFNSLQPFIEKILNS